MSAQYMAERRLRYIVQRNKITYHCCNQCVQPPSFEPRTPLIYRWVEYAHGLRYYMTRVTVYERCFRAQTGY